LVDGGLTSAQVFLLEQNDIDEDTAARIAAEKITGTGLKVKPAGKGRANIMTTCDGLFIPGSGIDTINRADDAFSAASLASHAPVRAGQLVATIKLIPYGLPSATLDNIPPPATPVSVSPFQAFKALLIVTGETPTKKTITSLTSRIERMGGTLQAWGTVKHDKKSVIDSLAKAKLESIDLILMLGASAISDKRDIFPSALIECGGQLIKLGMPADPGNLLMLGKLGKQTVIGLPGCARSPALNGFDWVLERFAAKEPIDAPTLTQMGTGGLLKEPVGRIAPRKGTADQAKSRKANVAAIVLAAGKSSRAKNIHKLLSTLAGKTVIATTIDSLISAEGLNVLVVTGHKSTEIIACLENKSVAFVHNAEFDQGMGTSIAAGVGALEGSIDYALICLGDMPFVQQTTIQKIMDTAAETSGAAIFVPTFHGKRGHPVLWHQRFFDDLKRLHGDTGGKQILQNNFEKIVEVPVDDAGILIDLDTPEMLAQFGVTPTDQ
jgi:molybdenum cofactor cytidylyltransferase